MEIKTLYTGDAASGRPGQVAPIIRAKSPMRMSFAGGGTDLPHWFNDQPGAVLSAAINRYAYVTLYPREDKQVQIRSVDLDFAVQFDVDRGPVYDGVLDLAKAAIRRLGVRRGLDLDVRSDAPAGSGLGGSSALTSATIGAVAAYTGAVLSDYELAELNYIIEREDLSIAGGKQDQYATTFGGFNLIEFYKDRVLVNPLRVNAAILNDLEAHLLMLYTGKPRASLGLIDKQVILYKEKRQDTIDGMTRLYGLVFEMKEALLRGKLDVFGESLHESYICKKRMNPHITEGTSIDEMYEEARRCGAIGGKLPGAGGGGYFLLYCETGRQHQVRSALEKMGGVFSDFAFEGMGLQVWRSHCR